MNAPFTLTADELAELARDADPLVRVALATGCSSASFAGIFGPAIDPNDYRGWLLRMERGGWAAQRGARTLRADKLGGIYQAVDRAEKARPRLAGDA